MITSLFNSEEKELEVRRIAAKLLEADSCSEVFLTETQEEYDLLFEAIRDGVAPNDFNLGRSGMWLNKKRIYPPKAVAFH